MLWFRLSTLVSMVATLVMAITVIFAVLQTALKGREMADIATDPAKNGTLCQYVFLLVFQFFIVGAALFGGFVAFLTWRNNYQLDHKLRQLFIVWLAVWGCSALGLLAVCIFSLVSGKDSQSRMGYMYNIFQKYSQDQKFVASMERYQREGNCCGVYGPDDWLMVQLRMNPMSGGGGGGFQSMDYGFRQNPSTGKCHLVPPTIPAGCGKRLFEEINSKLALYAGLTIFETVIALACGVLAWYCFFYWLEKEVIVIPEDEVSNLIIIEPESSSSIMLAMEVATNPTFPNGRGRSGYLNSLNNNSMRSRKYDYLPVSHKGQSNAKASVMRSTGPKVLSILKPQELTTDNPPTPDPLGIVPSQKPVEMSDLRAGGSGRTHRTATRAPDISQQHGYLGSSRRTQRQSLMRGTYLNNTHGVHHKSMNEHEMTEHILRIQEKALGGKVLGEMHIDHKKDAHGAQGTDPTPKDKRGHKKHATIAIIKNNNPPDKNEIGFMNHKMKGHGQTGHLAEDIAEMSGKRALDYIDDVMIPVNNPHVIEIARQFNRPPTTGSGWRNPKDALSVAGTQAQLSIENFLEPEAPPVLKPEHPHYLQDNPLTHHHHHHHQNGHGTTFGSRQDSRYLPGAGINNHHYGINSGGFGSRYLSQDNYIGSGTRPHHGGYEHNGTANQSRYLNQQHEQYGQHGKYLNEEHGPHHGRYLNEEQGRHGRYLNEEPAHHSRYMNEIQHGGHNGHHEHYQHHEENHVRHDNHGSYSRQNEHHYEHSRANHHNEHHHQHPSGYTLRRSREEAQVLFINPKDPTTDHSTQAKL